jgi:hypothetical protein
VPGSDGTILRKGSSSGWESPPAIERSEEGMTISLGAAQSCCAVGPAQIHPLQRREIVWKVGVTGKVRVVVLAAAAS